LVHAFVALVGSPKRVASRDPLFVQRVLAIAERIERRSAMNA